MGSAPCSMPVTNLRYTSRLIRCSRLPSSPAVPILGIAGTPAPRRGWPLTCRAQTCSTQATVFGLVIMAASRPLAGRVALVTGGAKRLGRASALALAGAGADVAITYLQSSREAAAAAGEIARAGVRSLALRSDVTDQRQVRRA